MLPVLAVPPPLAVAVFLPLSGPPTALHVVAAVFLPLSGPPTARHVVVSAPPCAYMLSVAFVGPGHQARCPVLSVPQRGAT